MFLILQVFYDWPCFTNLESYLISHPENEFHNNFCQINTYCTSFVFKVLLSIRSLDWLQFGWNFLTLFRTSPGYSNAMIINNYYWMSFEHDSDNYQGQSLCYLPKPKAEGDITNWGLQVDINYRYHAKTESNNCFVMHIPELRSAMTKLIKLMVSVLPVGDVTSACIQLLSVGMT